MNFISCKLMGGLGNQMFQAAHAMCQGLLHNRPMYLLPHWCENYKENIFRKFRFGSNHHGFIEVNEGPWEYSVVNPVMENTVFTGYFQSSKNFLGFHKEVREIFSPNNEIIKILKLKYPELEKPNTLSIHIRRGDCFLNLDIHPIISRSYLDKALEKIQSYSHMFIFSDDKDWVENNLKFENCTIVNEIEDYMEIWIMSLCQNNIISNSTFSWWGCFLGENVNKRVIAPSIWFGPRGPKKFYDIYEKNWEIINVEYKNGWLI